MMKKILALLTIFMMAIVAKADDVEIKKTNFSDYTSTTYGLYYTMGDYLSMSVNSNTPGGVTASSAGISINYNSQCTIQFGVKTGATIKHVELTFSDAEHSLSNESNCFDASNSTNGIIVSGNQAAYNNNGTTVTICCQPTDKQTHNLNLTGILVAYEEMIYVYTAAEFAQAVKWTDANGKHTAGVRLMQDIDISSLTETTDGYLFKFDDGFCGTITGENILGEDYALKNSTHPLFYHTSGANISYLVLNGFNVSGATSLIARTSANSTFKNIKVKNSALNAGDSGYNIGMIAGYSESDNFVYCTVCEGCSVESELNKVGGIAGDVHTGSTFSYCCNSGTVKSTLDNILSPVESYVGGIVGYADEASLERCLNTGIITGQDYEGGIAGYTYNTSFNMCVNTATIKKYKDPSYRRAGIIGECHGGKVNYCMNFGDIEDATINEYREYTSSIVGPNSSTDEAKVYLYYAHVKGELVDNLSTANTTYDEIMSGKYAYTAKNGNDLEWLYQDIDNNTFCTKYPVPIPLAGTVYSNILCDGTQSYSNRYQSTGSHTGVADQFGRCTTCGKSIGSVATDIHVTNAAGLMRVATEVNGGTNCRNSTIYLDNDIDMEGCSYTPIGSSTYPFDGNFDGQGHHIKNLIVYGGNQSIGLFGTIRESMVENVVIDNTCAFYNTANGTAGVVGCITKPATGTDNHIVINNCGNEATVSSTGVNSGGILGGVYDNDNTEVYIKNCYNTGSIKGSKESAAIVGYARKYTYLENCWNSGSVSGVTSNMSLWYTNVSGNECSATTCYDINGQSGTTKITAEDLSLGILCNNVNTNAAQMNSASFANPYHAWTQNIESDTHPTFGDAGLHYARTMANEWGTVVLPFDVTYDADNTNYNLYYLSGTSKDALTFTEYASGTIAAGTPMVVKKLTGDAIDIAPASTPNISATINAFANGGLTANGTYTQTTIGGTTDNGIYFLAQNKFWRADVASTVKPFRAWFEGTLPTEAKSFNIIEGDELTGIGQIENGELRIENSGKYLENGRIVIIKNNKKFNVNGQEIK